MKFTFSSLIVGAALLLGIEINAQSLLPFQLSTNVLAANTTNTTPSAPLFIGSQGTSIFACGAAGVTNSPGPGTGGSVTYNLQGAWNTNVNDVWFNHPFDTNYTQSVALVRGATNGSVQIINTQPFHWLRVSSMANTSTNNNAATPFASIWKP